MTHAFECSMKSEVHMVKIIITQPLYKATPDNITGLLLSILLSAFRYTDFCKFFDTEITGGIILEIWVFPIECFAHFILLPIAYSSTAVNQQKVFITVN